MEVDEGMCKGLNIFNLIVKKGCDFPPPPQNYKIIEFDIKATMTFM